MALWKISAKRKFNSGAVAFEPGMEIDFVLAAGATTPWAQLAHRQAIAEAFINKYGLKCSVEKFVQQINNVNFDYQLIHK